MAEKKTGVIASEVSTGTTGADGKRKSKDSDWSEVTVPKGFVINKEETDVEVISARGSEHSYIVEYDDEVEIIPGTGLEWPTTIRVKTHARSSKGHFGGGGAMKVRVHFVYVEYK